MWQLLDKQNFQLNGGPSFSSRRLHTSTRYYIRRPCFKFGEVPPRYEKVDTHPFFNYRELTSLMWPRPKTPSSFLKHLSAGLISPVSLMFGRPSISWPLFLIRLWCILPEAILFWKICPLLIVSFLGNKFFFFTKATRWSKHCLMSISQMDFKVEGWIEGTRRGVFNKQQSMLFFDKWS